MCILMCLERIPMCTTPLDNFFLSTFEKPESRVWERGGKKRQWVQGTGWWIHLQKGKKKSTGGNLEGKIESQWWIVAKNTAGVATPKREDAFISGNPHNAVHQTLVARMLAICDHHVAVLCLEQQLGSLHRGNDGVCHASHDGTHHQIPWEIGPCFFPHLFPLLLLLLLLLLTFFLPPCSLLQVRG